MAVIVLHPLLSALKASTANCLIVTAIEGTVVEQEGIESVCLAFVLFFLKDEIRRVELGL